MARGVTGTAVRLAANGSRQVQNQSTIPRINNQTPLSFEDFTAVRRQAEQALQNQRQLLQQRQNELATWDSQAQQRFQNAFGTKDEATRQQIQGMLSRELDLNRNMSANNFQIAPNSKPGRFAYVDPNDPSHAIYLDQGFASALSQGTDSTAGVLTHEMSHFSDICGTDDFAYGIGNSTGLSQSYQSNPATSVAPANNADNVEYYIEGAFDDHGSDDVPMTP
jgi:hypothetical protein